MISPRRIKQLSCNKVQTIQNRRFFNFDEYVSLIGQFLPFFSLFSYFPPESFAQNLISSARHPDILRGNRRQSP